MFLADINLQRNQLKEVVIHLVNGLSGIASPPEGMLVFDQADKKLKFYDGTQWVVLGSAEWVEDVVGALIQDSSTIDAQYDDAAGVLTLHVVRKTTGLAGGQQGEIGADGAGIFVRLGIGSATRALPGNVRLNEILPPTGDVDIGSNRLINVADPVADTDAANKRYVDAARAGLDAKESVRVATTGNITLSGTQTVDGVMLSAGDRVLVRAQNNAAENGIYVVSTGAWQRAEDADTWDKLVGAFVFVEEGATYADTGFLCTADRGGTLGTTPVQWTQFSSLTYTAGDGIQISGQTISARTSGNTTGFDAGNIVVKNSATLGQVLVSDGSGSGEASWGALDLSGNGVTGVLSVAKGGTGATTASAARVNLGAAGYATVLIPAADNGVQNLSFPTLDCFTAVFQLYDNATNKPVEAEIEVTGTHAVIVRFGRVGSVSNVKVVAIGKTV